MSSPHQVLHPPVESGSSSRGPPAAAYGLSLPPPAQLQPVHVRSSYSFTTGIIIGQASVLVLLFLVVRYVVFEDGKAGLKRRAERARAAGGGRQRRPSYLARLSSAPPPPISSAQLLSKAGYDISSHPAESMDWLNVLLAQVVSNYRASMLAHKGEEGARQRVEEMLNPAEGVSWLDPIRVTSLTLGSSYPLFSNARIRPSDASGRLRAETELEYSDSVTLAISTGLVINFPKPRFAVLPISLGVTLVGLHGTMTVELLSSPTSPDAPTPHQSLRLSLHPDFDLDLSTTSLLGSRAKLQDLPKIEQLVRARLRQALVDRVVWPCFWAVGLPALGPGVSGATAAAAVAAAEEAAVAARADEVEGDEGEEEDDGAVSSADDGEDAFGVEERAWERLGRAGLGGRPARASSLSASDVGERLDMAFTGRFAAAGSLADALPTTPAPLGLDGSRRGGAARRRRPAAAPRRETGLGGGVRTMPGGSDWGDGGGM